MYIETWLEQDTHSPIVVNRLCGVLFSADVRANKIGVTLTTDGKPATITDGCQGYFVRNDGYTILVGGTVESNTAYVILPSECYDIAGQFSLVIKTGTTTIAACTGNVYRSRTDDVVDPVETIPSLEELLARIGAMETATAAANKAAEDANTAAEDIADEIEKSEAAIEKLEDAEAWAVGTRGGDPVSETDPAYQNSAKYHAEAAKQSYLRAAGYERQAGNFSLSAQNSAAAAGQSMSDAAGFAESAKTSETNASNSASSASRSAGAAATSEKNAGDSAKSASDSAGAAATSEKNAGDSAKSASNSAGAAATSEKNAEDSAKSIKESEEVSKAAALKAEGYAKGTQDGEEVDEESIYYRDNAKFYYEQTVALAGHTSNWVYAQRIVRMKLGPLYYPVGTQLKASKENSLSAAMGIHKGITAVSVNEEKFLSGAGIVGTGLHEFVYDGAAWRYGDSIVSLATYGLTVTGTPAEGDEIIVTEAFDDILFDVADHGYVDPDTGLYIPASKVTDSTDKSQPAMALLMHYCIYNRQFDAIEAAVYAEEELPAGTYHFTLLAGYDTANDGGKSVQFTLTKPVPAGGQIVMNWPYNQTWIGKNVTTYAGSDSTTAIETAVTSEGTDGADLGTADGTSPNVNHTQRLRYGSNNYAESALLQWVNADGAKAAWWKPTNKFDRPASYAANTPGFLHGMDSDFLSAVREVTVPWKTNNTFELDTWTKNTAHTMKSRFFLASRDEIGYGIESGIAEGGAWALFNGVTQEEKIKRDIAVKTTARIWWLRSPYPSIAVSARYVNTTGALGNYNACYGNGAAPACIIY